MAQSITCGTLDGIIKGACRQLKIDPKPFYPRAGGGMTTGNMKAEWYVPIQNSKASVNTKKAKAEHLVRRCFCLHQTVLDKPPELRILEWSADKDWQGEYRTVWSAPAGDMAARAVMLGRFVESYNELLASKQAA